MPLKCIFGELRTPFDDSVVSYPINAYLGEECRYASSDLHVTENVVPQIDYLFSFSEIGHVSFVIYSSGVEPGSCFFVGTP